MMLNWTLAAVCWYTKETSNMQIYNQIYGPNNFKAKFVVHLDGE